jgi:hypothetical protein
VLIEQEKQKLHVFNLLSHNSIEMKIATGLLLKQNLFDGVLSENSLTDEVDFSEKGKSQFIRQLEEVMSDDQYIDPDDILETEVEAELEVEEELEEMTTELSGQPEQFVEKPEQEKKEEKQVSEKSSNGQENTQRKTADIDQMEEVMTKGMEFLTGIYKMSTGNDINESGKPKVNVNKETGEVSITFKVLPRF